MALLVLLLCTSSLHVQKLSHRDRGSTRRSSFPGTSSQIAERERAGTAAGTPAELDPAAARGNSTAPPRELDRAAVGTRRRRGNGRPSAALGRARSRVACLLHRGKVREAKRKRSAAPINQHREGGRSRASAGTSSLVPSRRSGNVVPN
jgi:hypothetical protein